MTEYYCAYLDLLNTLTEKLQELSQLAKQKAEIARCDDLQALDAVMRQEQAFALSFRGLEQKKDTIAQKLGLETVSLSSLADHFPSDLQLRARKTVDALRSQYEVYRFAAEVARNTIECNLHEIDKFIASQDAASVAGPGYDTPSVTEPPPTMKSDFRA